jgi:hypothetical protein
MESDWSVTRLDGRDDVALVTIELRNPSPVARRVRVENRLDGPVLPPRSAGVPDPEWDDDGFVGVVPAEGTRALGYATPATPSRPAVTVVDEGRATGQDDPSDASAAARELPGARPPVDAVPDPESAGAERENPGQECRQDAPADDHRLPPELDAWLRTVEERIERGERLTEGSATTVTDELEGFDRDDDVVDLEERLTADLAALRALTERTAALADRAAAVDVPVEALRRLA